MFVVCFSAKGGSGTTVVAAALTLLLADVEQPVLAVDLAGDLPAALGLAEPPGPGLHDWLTADRDVGPAALSRLAVEVGPGAELVPCGNRLPTDRRPWSDRSERWDELAVWLAARDGHVVVDAGSCAPGELIDRADRALLITRPCYLSLRRAAASGVNPSGVVLIGEPGRALTRGDVSRSLGVDVVAEIPHDPTVARAVDAGLLAARLPAALRRPLGPVTRAPAA